MIVSTHQPNYIPWIGYFRKILQSDLFVALDTVQLANRGFTNRNKILYPDGEARWLTVPVNLTDSQSRQIKDILVNEPEFTYKKHLAALDTCYKKAPFYKEVLEAIKPTYERKPSLLADLNLSLIRAVLQYLGVNPTIVLASDYVIPEELQKSDLIAAYMQAAKATTYLSGTGAQDYNDEAAYQAAGMQLEYSTYQPETYPQTHAGFTSHLRILDLLFQCGKESLQYILRKQEAPLQTTQLSNLD